MNKTFTDIREKLSENAFYNAAQVRLSLVNRMLQKLGWDIWNPREVYSQFAVAPSGEKTKVDLALFADDYTPSVFITVKSLDSIVPSQARFEREMREYNRSNPALFSIITDGKMWRFYLSNKGGDFADKCYKVISIQDDDIDELERVFSSLLSKKAIVLGSAKKEADICLEAALKEKEEAAKKAAEEAAALKEKEEAAKKADDEEAAALKEKEEAAQEANHQEATEAFKVPKVN